MSFSAKLSISCLVLLIGLYFTLQLDLAFALSVISIFILFNLPSILLFVFAAIYFFIFLISQKLYLDFGFIGDLSVTAYLLFFAGIVVSLWWTEDKRNKYFSIKFLKQLISHKDVVVKLAISISLGLLISPIGGFYTSSILSYLLFCFFSGRNTGRIAVILSLILLAFIPILLSYKQETMVDGVSILIFLFLTIGIFQEFITYIRLLKKLSPSDLYLARVPERFKPENKTYLSHRERIKIIKTGSFTEKDYSMFEFIKLEIGTDLTRTKPFLLSHRKNKILGILLIIMLFLLVLIWLVYFHFRILTKPKILNIGKQGKITPTLIPILTLTPAPTLTLTLPELKEKIASESFSLKISVLNSTDIKGLAASIAAQLKTSGFKNVTAGNADKRDLEVWQIAIKEEDPKIVSYLKKILDLQESEFLEATSTAKADIEIVIGAQK